MFLKNTTRRYLNNMRINFKQIEIHSFMSFEDQIFDFSNMNGMTLVQGKNNDIPNLKNGSGKSTLFMSLLYALFGQLQNKIKNENIVNRYATDKDTRVVLAFDIDGQQYKIVRGIAKGKTSYLNLYQIDNDNENDITQSTISETQSFIEEQLLHCDITIFMRTIMLSADQTYNFYTLKKADKKEFVEKLFDISLFEEMYQMIHKDKNTIDKTLLSQQNQLLVLTKNVEDYRNLSTTFKTKNGVDLENAKAELHELQSQLTELKNNVVTANSEAVEKIADAISKLEHGLNSTNANWKSAVDKNTKLKLAKQKIVTEIDVKKGLIAKHNDIESKLCDDCRSLFRGHYGLDQAQQVVDELNNKLQKVEAAILEGSNAENKQKQLLSKLQEKLSIARQKNSELMSEQIKYMSQVSKTEQQIKQSFDKVSQFENAVNPYDKMLIDAENNVEQLTSSIKSNTMRHNYLEYAENIVSQDTLRKFIIKDLIVLLNNRIKTYLMRLGAKYYVQFDEDMDYDFIVPNGTCEFGNFSAGERMRLMIATSLAFRDFMSIRNGLNANVLILDEYFDSAIDSICVESMLKILNEYKTQMRQNIFVISHRLEVNLDQFDRTIIVEKTNNLSKVVFV